MTLIEPNIDVISEISTIRDAAVAAGMRRDGVHGATAAQISDAMYRQRVHAIPAAVHVIWELLGADAGPFRRGSTCTATNLGADAKAAAQAALAAAEVKLVDPAGILVLLEHGGYQFEVIDGADLGRPNPPVWLVCAGGVPMECRWPSVTEWFRSALPGVMRSKLRFDEHIQRGGRDAVGARHFR